MLFRKKEQKYSLEFIAFLQAWGLVLYCGLVALLLWNGEKWFGAGKSYLGPVLVLTLFATSALVCGLIVFGYPIYLFWDEKKTCESLKIVAYTAGWLIMFILLLLLSLAIFT